MTYVLPGTKYNYSTHGWTLISAVLEKVSDKQFLEYMDDHIFKPLGMTSTGGEFQKPLLYNRARYVRTLSVAPFPGFSVDEIGNLGTRLPCACIYYPISLTFNLIFHAHYTNLTVVRLFVCVCMSVRRESITGSYLTRVKKSRFLQL